MIKITTIMSSSDEEKEFDKTMGKLLYSTNQCILGDIVAILRETKLEEILIENVEIDHTMNRLTFNVFYKDFKGTLEIAYSDDLYNRQQSNKLLY